MNPTEQAVDAALREARNNALEAAARVCDEDAERHAPNAPYTKVAYWTVSISRNHADRIRALKSKESK